MKKVLLLACLGTAMFIGACAPKPKVEPAATPKTADSSTGGNKDYLGASGGAGSAASPSGGAGLGSPVMGTVPESTPTDFAPRSGGGGAAHPTAGASRVSTAKPATAKPTASAHGAKYVVKRGETLSGIAKKHYGKTSSATIKKIVAANPGLNPDKIRAGQSIVLP